MKLIIFYISCFLAFVAGHMVNYTAILYSLAEFDSSLLAGSAYALCFGPPVILGWIAGAYIDRYSAKRVLLLAQNFFILGAAGMFLVILNPSELTVLFFLFSSFLVGVGWSFVAPARLASIGQYVEADKIAQATIIFNILIMLGFGLAPIVISQLQPLMGWSGVVSVCVIMFIFSSVLLLNAPNVHQRLSHDHLLEEWKQCFVQIQSNPIIFQLLLATIIVYLMMGPMQVVLPQIAEHQLGLDVQQKGNYLGLIAFSLIIGGLVAIKFKHIMPIGLALLGMLSICGLTIGMIGYISEVWISCLVLILSTVLAGTVVSFIVAGLQHFTPVAIRGRVMSIYTIINQVIAAVSGLLAGAISQAFNMSISLYFIGATIVLLTLLLFFNGRHIRAFSKL